MPHFILEYTDNLNEELDIQTLLQKVNESLLKHRDIIPVGGLRSRAIELKNYVVADGSADDAFIHCTLKLGKGRAEEDIKKIGDDLFQVLQEHLKSIFEKRYFAVSLELYEFQRETYKWNNIHTRYK